MYLDARIAGIYPDDMSYLRSYLGTYLDIITYPPDTNTLVLETNVGIATRRQ